MEEEIEKAKENLYRSLKDLCFSTLYSQEEADRDTEIILRALEARDKKIKELEKRERYIQNKLLSAIELLEAEDKEREFVSNILKIYNNKSKEGE